MYLLLLAPVSVQGLLGPIIEQFQGIASVAIGGTTLHSWAGIGLGKGPVDNLMWKVKAKLDACDRWKKTEVLVIDESTLSLPADDARRGFDHPHSLYGRWGLSR